jgi:predicted nucleotidyltransferase
MIDALFPRTRQRVLAFLFGQADRAFGTSELIGLVGAGSGAVQREIERLIAGGLVVTVTTGAQKRFQANRDAPIFAELLGIVEKTSGIADVLRRALAALSPPPKLAILYGSVAKGSERAGSDIDVLIVGDDLALEDVFAALQPAERSLGRRVSPTVYTIQEFERRRRSNPFVTKVMAGKHVVLLRNEDGVGATR